MSNIAQSPTALVSLVLGLGLTGIGIVYVLYYYIVQHMGAVQASGVTYLPPIVALSIGILLVGEPAAASRFDRPECDPRGCLCDAGLSRGWRPKHCEQDSGNSRLATRGE
jgi:hypothetical protein